MERETAETERERYLAARVRALEAENTRLCAALNAAGIAQAVPVPTWDDRPRRRWRLLGDHAELIAGALLLLVLVGPAWAGTLVARCPAQGPFRTLYAGIDHQPVAEFTGCGYDQEPTIAGTGVACECPNHRLLAACGAQLLEPGDGTAFGVCEEFDTAGHRRVTWQGRVR